tara:strand:- start:1025 stop:1234 length:210 start_codon:yes stop_codon:yes gene_type:complete
MTFEQFEQAQRKKYKATAAPKDVTGVVDALTKDFTTKQFTTDDVLKKIRDEFFHDKDEAHHAKVIVQHP